MRVLNKVLVVCCLLALVLSKPLLAAGTAANTIISNTATVNFVLGGIPGSANDTTTFVVEELLDVALTWQDGANVAVLSPSTTQILTYQLTNLGNGSEQFLLSVDAALAGDDFDPLLASVQIWIDDGSGALETATDTLYTGANGPILDGGTPANDQVLLFVVANIPPGLNVSDIANVELTATGDTANTAGQVGNVGAPLPGAGDGGVDANVGVSGAVDNAIASYEIVDTGVTVTKSVTIVDTLGGSDPHPGARLQYTLLVNVAGSNTVDNLVITDVIPANTTYTGGSLVLDTVAQTDADDAPATDFSDFNLSNANAITVDLSQAGTVSITPPASFTINFEVTID